MPVSLGGFVLHGNNVATLGPCLDSLLSVCDEVVALDSQSTDGSVALALARGVSSETRPWRGFGAARATAVGLLGAHDYILFLDSDEAFAPGAADAIRAWKQGAPSHAFYRLLRRDWVTLGERRFLYRVEHKRRLIRRDVARWSDAMLVHEALPKGDAGDVAAVIDHAFTSSVAELAYKGRQYALLWALQHRAARSWTPAPLIRLGHVMRDGLLKGAFFRGGAVAWTVAQAVAEYHVLKYRYARALAAGGYADCTALLAAGDLPALYRRVAANTEAPA